MDVTAASLAAVLQLGWRTHPGLAACVPQAEAWAQRFQDLDGGAPPAKVRAWRFAALAAGMFPDADAATIALAADFTNWIAVVDDRVEKWPAQIPGLRALHRARGHTGLAGAWSDIAARLTAGAPQAFAARVDAHLAALFDAYAWEARFRERGEVPPFEEFRVHRPVSGGLPLYLLMLERACGGAPAASPARDEVDRKIGNLACWANDLLSHQWDRSSDNPINLVRVFEARVGPERALEAAAHAFAEEWHGWQALRRSTPELAASPYVAAQPALVTGVLAWMESTERYRAASSRADR